MWVSQHSFLCRFGHRPPYMMLVVNEERVSEPESVCARGRKGKNIKDPARTDAHHTQRTAPARDRAANAARRPARSRAGGRVHIDTRRAALTAPTPPPTARSAARAVRTCRARMPGARAAAARLAAACDAAPRAPATPWQTRREAAVSALGGDRGGVSAAPAGRRVAGGTPAAGAVVVVALRDLWGRGGHANPPCGGRPGRPTAARGPRTGRRPTRR